MSFFEPSHAIVGTELYRAYGTSPFQLRSATNHLYSLVDTALQRSGMQWQFDTQGQVGQVGQVIPPACRTLNAATDPLVVVVLRAFHDRAIRSAALREYLAQLVEDFCWLALERGLAVREQTSWRLLPPPTSVTAPIGAEMETNHHDNSKNRRSTPRNIESVTTPKTRRARANSAKPVS